MRMTGAVITIGVLAAIASAMATVTNMVIKREFPPDIRRLKFDRTQDQSYRFGCYQLTANIFYYQSLILWAALVALVGIKVLGELG